MNIFAVIKRQTLNSNTIMEKENESKRNVDLEKYMYEKAHDSTHYFLNWRQILFAGYIAIASKLLFEFFKITPENPNNWQESLCITLGIIFISIIFLLLDKRNTEIYHSCQEVCKEIEILWFNNESNHLSLYNKMEFDASKRKIKANHTNTIHFFYISISVISILLFVCRLANWL